ncbi:hypothetical protein HTZ84_00605 [Haloterrigena sp. SYSU A558-1]|uniref:Halobacterial output domain-containing protein n=1 Tax=Haloterrigena gelatinilytica TaxID=2741724 RepID=A0A8J8GNZ4_9EURY|nr:HalOD1 output domain-containing protein [Haloterrigena gelatinilytica]NUB93271.1 hypothetical protein [Haloterrigena gelatinilytica]NUC70824.1 hypothetical protein [Haloterrigena gelatinilytica]
MTGGTPDAIETLEYEPKTDTYRIAYDAGTTPPSLAVVSALDSLSDGGFDAPLYDVIDPDALDRLLSPSEPAETADRRSISFAARGFRITVSSRGYLEVRSDRDGDGAEGSE